MLCLCPETGIYVIFYTSASNVISSSPPTRPFHWGLIKCMVDTPEETRTGEHQLWPRGGQWRAWLKGSRSCLSRMRFNTKRRYFRIRRFLSFPPPLSLSFFLSPLSTHRLCYRVTLDRRNNFSIRAWHINLTLNDTHN